MSGTVETTPDAAASSQPLMSSPTELERAAREQQNALLPINSLPPELLARFFQARLADAISRSPTFPYRWTDVSHVCRLWRRVAIGAPLLWGYITSAIGGSPLFDLYLSRSGEAPLRFHVTHVESPLPARLLGFPVFQRMRSYFLKGAVVVQQFVDHGFPDGARNLRSLELDSADGNVVIHPQWSLHLPGLNKLSLRWMPSKFLMATSFPSLRVLELRNITPLLSSQLCLLLLGQLPLLETFRAHQTTGPEIQIPAADDKFDTVTHRNLRLLVIHVPDDPTILIEVLHHLVLNKSAKLEVRTDVGDVGETARVLAAIHANVTARAGEEHETANPVFDQFWLTSNVYTTRLRITEGPVDSFCAQHEVPSLDPDAAYCNIFLTRSPQTDALSQLCSRYLALADMRVLWIETTSRSLLAPWLEACRDMVNVEYLCTNSHIIPALFRLNEPRAAEGESQIPFPRLKSITLRRNLHEPHYPSALQKLWDMVRERNGDRAGGVSAIEEIHMCGWDPQGEKDLDDIHELENVGSRVVCHK